MLALVAFELVPEAFRRGSMSTAVAGTLAGALLMLILATVLGVYGPRHGARVRLCGLKRSRLFGGAVGSWELGPHGRARTLRRVDRQRSPDQIYSLAHPNQAVPSSAARRVEALSIVASLSLIHISEPT